MLSRFFDDVLCGFLVSFFGAFPIPSLGGIVGDLCTEFAMTLYNFGL